MGSPRVVSQAVRAPVKLNGATLESAPRRADPSCPRRHKVVPLSVSRSILPSCADEMRVSGPASTHTPLLGGACTPRTCVERKINVCMLQLQSEIERTHCQGHRRRLCNRGLWSSNAAFSSQVDGRPRRRHHRRRVCVCRRHSQVGGHIAGQETPSRACAGAWEGSCHLRSWAACPGRCSTERRRRSGAPVLCASVPPNPTSTTTTVVVLLSRLQLFSCAAAAGSRHKRATNAVGGCVLGWPGGRQRGGGASPVSVPRPPGSRAALDLAALAR